MTLETTAQAPSNVLPLPRWTVIIHAVQILLAIIILGFDAYGIHWVAYNALIYSLVTALLTLGICVYIVGTTLFLHKLYNAYVVLGLHILMVIFWIVDLGLVANLARIWANPGYGYYTTYGYYYSHRRVRARDTFTFGAYYGVLAAGAFFAAVQFALWILSTVFVLLYLNKQRPNKPSQPSQTYTGGDQAVPMATQPVQQTQQGQYQQYPQQPYQAGPNPQPQYAQQPVYSHQQQPVPHQQDPINRGQTVSPISQVGSGVPSQYTSELETQQKAGIYSAPENAAELSTPQNPGRDNQRYEK